jgi:serpin B
MMGEQFPPFLLTNKGFKLFLEKEVYMFKIIKYIFVLFIFIGFFQCTSNPFTPDIRELTQAEKGLVEADNKFGLKLFKEVVFEEDTDNNIFISPLSVSMALGMTYNGADGSTEEAMRTTLELSDLTLEEINESYKSLIEYLVGLDPEVEFNIANSIWYRQELTFEDDFLDRCETYFNALVSGLDFNDPNAKDIINAWVSENTNGKIEEIVDYIDLYTVMFLINAIYFKGTWTYRFDESLTHEGIFYLLDGSQVTCEMMENEGNFQYFENSDFQVIDLPYSYECFSMTIFLPKPEKNIDSLISEFNQENWYKWINSFSEQNVILQFPKFEIEYEIILNDVLKALGMEIAFSESQADFSKMYKGLENLYISEVKHKTFVKVDEEGTEAAAATSVEIGITSVGPFMRVDRPFIFAIRENHSGIILFIGKIVNPTS